MSKFLVEPRASMALGNTCAGCATHKHDDGFVNTNLDVLGSGRVYFCAGCVREMGHVLGSIDSAAVAVLHGQLEEMSAVNEQLHAALEQEKQNKVVRLAEVVDFFKERERRRPDEPKPSTQPKDAA